MITGWNLPLVRVALGAAPDVAQSAIDRLRRCLNAGGVCLCEPEDLLDGTVPAETPLLTLFRSLDAGSLARIDAVGARPGASVLGVVIAGRDVEADGGTVEATWRSAGGRVDDLLLWDGATEPLLVLRRILARYGPASPPSVAAPTPVGVTTAALVEVVLRTGRVLRVRPDLPPDMLRCLVSALEE